MPIVAAKLRAALLLISMSAFPQNIGIGYPQMVWLFSGLSNYNNFRPIGYPSYLTIKQQARLERIRQARMLHDGRHQDYYLLEGRTQFDFPESMSQGRRIRPYVPYNLLKLITWKSADLLFGAEPSIRVEDQIQNKAVEDLATRTSLHKLLYHTAGEASCDGEAAIEAVTENGQTYLKRIDAADIFPQGPIQPDGQFKSYVRYNAHNFGDDNSPNWAVLVTTYTAGLITREIKQLNMAGAFTSVAVPPNLSLNAWPQEDPEADDLEPVTRTGIDRNTITWMPNLLVRDIAISDYDGLVEKQDLLNAKRTQIARVLSKHSDPKLAVPRASADNFGNLPHNTEVFFTDLVAEAPKYITWDAQLTAAMADFMEVRSAMLLESETSPILLGIKDHATAHVAYKSVRLEATNSLTKAQRKAVIFRAAIKRMLSVAQDLEQTIPGVRYNRLPLGVEMRDGLPIDTDLQANELSVLRAAGLLSVERGVGILIEDPAAREKELTALEDERAAATPSILMQPPKPGADADGEGGEVAAGEANADADEAAVED
jgi:hypothetical protein